MLYRAQGVSRLGYAESSDGIRFTRRADPVLSRRPGKFDSRVVASESYARRNRSDLQRADDKLVYRTGIAVFDRRDPRKLIYRGESALFKPELAWGNKARCRMWYLSKAGRSTAENCFSTMVAPTNTSGSQKHRLRLFLHRLVGSNLLYWMALKQASRCLR
jgi:hypothetical protein